MAERPKAGSCQRRHVGDRRGPRDDPRLLRCVLRPAPFLAKDLGLTYSQVGVIISLRQLMSALVNLPAGAVVDTLGRRSLFMSLALAWAALPYLLISLTSSYAVILLSMGVVGVGSFLWHPAAITALSELYPTRRGYGLALHELGANLGDTLTPLAAGFLLAALNWRHVLLIIVAAGLLITLAVIWMMAHAHRRRGAAPSRTLAAKDYVHGLGLLLRNGPLLILAMVSGVRAMTQLGLSTFLPLYLLNELHLPAALMGLYLAVVQGSGMIATPIAGALSDRLGPKRIATAGMLTTSLIILGFAALNLGAAFVGALALHIRRPTSVDTFTTPRTRACILKTLGHSRSRPAKTSAACGMRPGGAPVESVYARAVRSFEIRSSPFLM